MKKPTLTVIIVKEYPEKQFDYAVYDLLTNQWFKKIINDSVYQIEQSVLKDSSLLFLSGAYSCIEHIKYKKSGKNDTIILKPLYCLPITIKKKKDQ